MKLKVKIEQLIEIRIRKGMSQTELASKAGITSGYVSQIEHGHYSPSPKAAHRIARALGVEFDEIFLLDKPRHIEGKTKIEGTRA